MKHLRPESTKRIYTVLFPFGGIGAGALGFLQAQHPEAEFVSLGGIDFDALACEDFEMLTGSKSWCADVTDTKTVTPQALREHFGEEPADVVIMSPPCLPSDGLVLTPTGPRKIETMRAGQLVLTHKGRFQRVLQVGRHIYKGTMYGVRLRGTVDVQEFTAEHPILVRRYTRPVIDGKQDKRIVGPPSFKPASEVRTNDFVGFPVDLEEPGCALQFIQSFGDPTTGPRRVTDLTPHATSKELWFLFGAYLGDGYRRIDAAHKEAIFCIGPSAADLANRVRSALKHVGVNWTEDTSSGSGNIKLRANSKHLCTLLGAFGDGAENKFIPPPLFHLETELLTALLDGYHSTDGCEFISEHKGGTSVPVKKIASVSLQLLRDAQRAFLRLGQFWGLHVSAPAGSTVIEGRTVKTRARWEICYRVERSKVGAAIFEDGMVWTKIRTVEARETEEPVWNLEVEEDNTFCVPMMATHNCKGSSSLLGKAAAISEKYQAMNRLAYVWVALMLAAWGNKRPRVILFENVPRITSRAAKMLADVRELLTEAGYELHEGFHDCGVLGGLAQHRRRYLMIARHRESVPHLIYQPMPQRVKGCGEVLGELPLPGDPAAGPMHRLPAISSLNTVRLAIIPAGGDWRDLPGVLDEGQPRYGKFKRHAVEDWQDAVGTVAGSGSNGVANVADPRLFAFAGSYGVMGWQTPACTITGEAAVSTGRASVADPRLGLDLSAGAHHNLYRLTAWGAPVGTVTSATRPGQGAPSIADPRLGTFHGSYGVRSWHEPAPTVTGGAAVSTGPFGVADPRLGLSYSTRRGTLKIPGWTEPSGAVTGQSGRPSHCSGGFIADPRLALGCAPRAGAYGVADWTLPMITIGGSACLDNGRFSVADPRLMLLVPTAYPHAYGQLGWSQAAHTVAGTTSVGCGAYSIADPRLLDLLPIATDNPGRHTNKYRVGAWEEPARSVIGAVQIGSGAPAVADPRLALMFDRPGYQSKYRVVAWASPTGTVIGVADLGGGAPAVADPRTPQLPEHLASHRVLTWVEAMLTLGDGTTDPKKPYREPTIVIASDGAWHRPLTTLELAVLQGLPATINGKPLVLAGGSSVQREHIGNAIPVGAARAIAEEMLRTLVASDKGELFLSSSKIWVAPEEPASVVASPLGVTPWKSPSASVRTPMWLDSAGFVSDPRLTTAPSGIAEEAEPC